jgi:hypothetical protein
MRRATRALAVLIAAIAVAAVLGMPGSGAQSPSLVGSWTVTTGRGQPDYLLVLTADGSAITTGTEGTTYIGAWEEHDGTVRIDLSTLALRGGPQGFMVEGPIQHLENGRIGIGGGRECSHCWVLSPYLTQRVLPTVGS